MHLIRAYRAALLTLLVAPTALATPVGFEAPATFDMETGSIQSGVVLLAFRSGSDWQLEAESSEVGSFLRHRYVDTTALGVPGQPMHMTVPEQPQPADWRTLSLAPRDGVSTLLVRADTLTGTLPASAASLSIGRGTIKDYWDQTWWTGAVRGDVSVTDHVVFEPRNGPANLTFSGLRSIEWVHADSSCTGGDACPEADDSGYFVDHIEQFLSSGTATLTGTPDFVAFLGPMDLSFQGTARLPGAAGTLECENCTVEDDTLVVHGALNLTDLRASQGGFTAELTGTYSVRVNESPLGFVSSAGAAVATAAVLAGVALLVKLLWPLVSKQILDRPLEQETRRLVFEAIESNPAVTHRELMRVTGLANGTVTHHLAMLERTRKVRSWLRGRKRHYAVASLCPDVALRRRVEEDTELAQLRSFVAAEGVVSPTGVERWGQERFGWARSTAQAKVEQLSEVGLVERVPMGRRRWFRAA